MLQEFKFPDVGEGIAEAEIIRWLVKEGDAVKEDQDLLEVETDKAILTLNSPYTGKVTKLHGKEGDIIKVGDVLTTFDAGGKEGTVIETEKKDSGTVVGTLSDNEVVEVIRAVQATPAVRTLAK
ncbi:MAG TPA: biotin/lipoyl-containing protein, partial [Candidatus Binatia bacterium]|nr:biotin/lipoyl-containing protein [Candidatus Binatia bacterium]